MQKVTMAELIELRRLVPPTPADADRASLADRFLIPPFSVLDARQGYWQKRKKMWIALGIQSELGRGENYDQNGSLGISEQARSHYKANAAPGGNLGGSALPPTSAGPDGKLTRRDLRAKLPNATVTGSPMPSTKLREDGKIQRGDGRARPLAQTYNSGAPSDLAAGFKRKADVMPGGKDGKNNAYLHKTPEGYKSGKQLGEEATANPARVRSKDSAITTQDWVQRKIKEGNLEEGLAAGQSGTSIFDPVLCEIAYRWFCPAGGRVLDPFAGGSVRGIVAARLGRAYAGADLRPEQVEANYVQAEVICPEADLTWVVGDSQGIGQLLPSEYDLIFSCPPYADLERYSNDPRDLSTMDYDAFLEAYRRIVAASCAMLRDDRFAVFVVGDVRDRKTGNYRGFVGDTIEAFRAAGLELYNEAVLVTTAGSLPIRVGKQFVNYRKLGRMHQSMLVFLKGDAGRATAACGEVDLSDLPMPEPRDGAVAICAQDCAGLPSEGLVDGDGSEVSVIPLPLTEACLLYDIIRGEARTAGKQPPRAWIGTGEGWLRVDDSVELTYLANDAAYLNKTVFPSAPVPTDAPRTPKKLR